MTPKQATKAYAEIHTALQAIYSTRDRLRDVEDTYDGITFTGDLFSNLAYVSNELRDHTRMLESEIDKAPATGEQGSRGEE